MNVSPPRLHWIAGQCSTVLLLLTGALIWPAPVSAQDTVAEAERYWTPERLARAQPRTLPQYQEPQGVPEAGFLSQDPPSAPGVQPIRRGQLPTSTAMNLPDLNNRLFPPGAAPTHDPGLPLPQPSDPVERPGGPRGEAAGTEGAHFSSSRLIPVDARLEYPYRAVGKLFFQNAQGQDFVCTAAVIAPRLILTAGHCVHQGSGGEGGYFRHIQFVPAYHEGNAPFQRWSATWVATTKSWMTGGGGVPNRADLAIIELEERHFGTAMRTVGSVTGILGHRTNALSRNQAKIIGYPVGFDNGQIMHQVDSGSHRDGGLSSWLYGSDMTGGSSGGPWIENFGVRAIGQTGGLEANPNRIVGVTSYGFVSNQPLVQGSSVLGQEFLDLLSLACARRQGNC